MTRYIAQFLMLSFSLAGLSFATASAQSVDAQLRTIERQAAEQARQTGVSAVKVLSDQRLVMRGSDTRIELEELEGFKNYLIVGVCDEKCNGLGLTVESVSITSPKDVEIEAQDISGTDMPVLELFIVPLTTTYTLNVSMLSCETLLCEYGVDIYKLD